MAAFAVASAALAQTAAAPPKFDVISVKPCTEGAAESAGGGRSGSADSRTARLHLPCQTVKNLILQAYFAYADGRVHPPPFPELEGGPSWIESARYIVDATSEAAVTHAMMNGPMLQALLQDRFQLKLRREMREGPAYALTVAKGGAKLTPYHEGDCVDTGLVKPLTGPPPPHKPGERFDVETPAGGVTGENAGSGIVRAEKGGHARRSDSRGKRGCRCESHVPLFGGGQMSRGAKNKRVAGSFQRGPAVGDAAAVPGPSIFIALQQQLGLKLEPTKAPREFLVIDSIQRPSEN